MGKHSKKRLNQVKSRYKRVDKEFDVENLFVFLESEEIAINFTVLYITLILKFSVNNCGLYKRVCCTWNGVF